MAKILNRRKSALAGALAGALAAAGALLATCGPAFASDAPSIPQKYIDKGLTVGMMCGTGVISFCDPGSTAGKGILAEFAHVWAEEAGISKVDVVGSAWESLMPSAISGRTDLIAGIGDYENRRSQFTFVDVFWNFNAILVKDGNPLKISGPLDLCGHSMAAANGSGELMAVQAFSKKCEEAGKPAITEVTFGEQAPTFLAVSTGRADATVTDLFAADEMIKNTPGVYQEAFRKKAEIMWGVAVPVDNKELLALVSYGVEKAIKDGRFKTILDKYGFGDILADQLMINMKPKSAE